MKLDLTAANAFLELLCSEFSPRVTFQTFDDNPDRKDPKLARIYHATLTGIGEELAKLNRLGAGIFVTINGTDHKGRKKSNIVLIRSCYIDIDGAKELPAFALEPSIIVKTPHGWHIYWLLEVASTMEPAECERVNKALAKLYGGDKAVTDCARVLRVPGFWHRKGEPQLIELIKAEDIRYTPEQLLEIIPPEPVKPKYKAPRMPSGRSQYGEAALVREAAAVASAPEHERNNTLNKAAFSLGQLVAGGELDAGDVHRELLRAGLAAGLVESEILGTIGSGLRGGSGSPRNAPRRGHLELASSAGPVALLEAPPHTDADAPPEIRKVVLPQPERTVEEWERSLRYRQVDGKLQLTSAAGNAALIMSHAEGWKGCLVWDEFAYRAFWIKHPPPVLGLTPPEGELADAHVLYCQHALAQSHGVSFSRDSMFAALDQAARNNQVHPVQDYLNSLEWDQHHRIHEWTETYLGASPTVENSRMGRWWLISAVARAMDPGCQADHVLILEAVQGAGKSSTVRILAGPWYQGNLGDIRDKEGAQSLQGHWLIEIGELDALRGAAVTRIKDFITQKEDIYRPSYGRLTVHRPRQCVFCGTTNDAKYLRDATGGRRFWPLACGKIDTKALEADRDQLWAEAMVAYKAGERWWPEGSGEVHGLQEVQEERYEIDPWEETVAAYLGRNPIETSCDELLEHIGLPRERWDRSVQMRIGIILKRLRWSKVRRRIHGTRCWRYIPPTGSAEPEELPFGD